MTDAPKFRKITKIGSMRSESSTAAVLRIYAVSSGKCKWKSACRR